jgi:hypothetical protein
MLEAEEDALSYVADLFYGQVRLVMKKITERAHLRELGDKVDAGALGAGRFLWGIHVVAEVGDDVGAAQSC